MAAFNERVRALIRRAKEWARRLKVEVSALYYAYRDPRTPWYAKALAALVVAYAFSPIDLIPDFIPVLGYLDDLLLIPLGVALVIRMIPCDVMEECREKARQGVKKRGPGRWVVTVAIILAWAAAFALIAWAVARRLRG
jgi:uncharacterized membrane protein YkvA (DUF1232 family)